MPSPAVAEITLEGDALRLSVEGLPLYFDRSSMLFILPWCASSRAPSC